MKKGEAEGRFTLSFPMVILLMVIISNLNKLLFWMFTKIYKSIEKKFGRLDILINNVGMNILTPSVVETDERLWDKILETNLRQRKRGRG